MKLNDCIQPWYEMQFDYHQTIRPCCFYKNDVDHFNFMSDENLSIPNIWNGKKFQYYRKIITGRNSDEGGCKNCEWITGQKDVSSNLARTRNWNYKIKKPKNLKAYEKKIENLKLAQSEFENGEIILKSLPTKIYINFGNLCNFKCTFCFQNAERDQNYNNVVTADKLISQKEHLLKATRIDLIGGEPLVIKESRKFLDYIIHDSEFHDTNLVIYTNGALLDKYINKLSVFDNLQLSISMETAGTALESLRVGSIWKKLEKNILDFKLFAKENNKNWSVSIACSVMRTSLENDGMYNLIKWCQKHDISIHFGYINGVTKYDYENEDFFKNPSLLKNRSLKNWKQSFEKCLNELQSNQDHYAYSVLNGIYNHAKTCQQNFSYRKKIIYDFDQYLRQNIVPKVPPFIRNKLKFIKKFGILN